MTESVVQKTFLMKIIKNKSFFFLAVLIFTSCNFINTEPQTLDAKITTALEQNDVPSLSIGIVENGEVTLLKGFEHKSRIDKTNVDENSIFQIASQSKMFTGIIVNNLIQEGKLNLNESITKYFTNDISEKNKKLLKKIKLVDILNHTSGISRNGLSVYRNRKEGEAWRGGYSRQELIEDINNIELDSEPGIQFQYSNAGYAIVGLICENVSGLEYEALLKKYVTNKYGLKNTVVNLDNRQQQMLVTPYKKNDRNEETQASIMGMATPASAIYSNASDLTKILSEQIKAYRLYQENKTQSHLILTQQTSDIDEGLDYGFGLIKETKADIVKYGHGGDADGFACEYFFNPKKNNGVLILTSSGGSWVGELAIEILEDLK